ncbi:hypothetical protein [Actinokineospora auranticolor]|uniref:hypothetical protein n=1 Tax=Actinokineospora auranticolor TaxID=155976 RepID=UPI0011B01C2C|nr:hypothetical protein [Actinokineospora auranticolor]
MGVSLLGAGVAAAQVGSSAGAVVVWADLNGDRVKDKVTLRPVAGSKTQQELSATVRGKRYTARMPLENFAGTVRQPVVVDLDKDRRKEVLVVESVGANTDRLSAWRLSGRSLVPVTSGGKAVQIWQGGGVSGVLRYGCEQARSGGRFVTVSAELDWARDVYVGERVTYTVRNGKMAVIGRKHIEGARTDAAFQTKPGACA